MVTYQLGPALILPNATKVSNQHFGVNVVTIYDQEFAELSEPLSHLVAQMGASTVRFPGGSATELYFDMTRPEAQHSAVPGTPDLTPMTPFLNAAARIAADVALVIPTRVAFRDNAAEALRAGTYGDRSAFDPSYLTDVATFVRGALESAQAAGTRIATLEIGNEFWGSGQMTAAEYGRLVARLAPHLEGLLAGLGHQDVQIVAQATTAASKIYAPRDAVTVFIDPNGTIYDTPPEGAFETARVPAQGKATSQLAAITQAINAAGVGDVLDGVVLHYYQRGGFAQVDGGRAFSFSQMDALEAQLMRSKDAPDLARHITEWNVAARDSLDNAGLRQASMLVEIFFELVQNGVTDAQIWPLSFNVAQGTALADMDDARLSIAGEMFRLMRESLPGLTPVLDFEVSGKIDLHGFASPSRAVLFVSDRSGVGLAELTLDARALAPSARYFVTTRELWDGGSGGSAAWAAPVLSQANGRVLAPDALEFSVNPWASLRVEFTEVGRQDDIVTARAGHDRIFTYGGADVVHAGEGHDYVRAGAGADVINGGAGNDWLFGDTGTDDLTGGAGRDTFVFRRGDGQDVITDFELGVDLIKLAGSRLSDLNELNAFEGVEVRQDGADLRITYGDGDSAVLLDVTLPLLLTGTGRITGGNGDDALVGSFSRDDLRGRRGDDTLEDGADRDVLRGGSGADRFVLHHDGAQDRITDFSSGEDVIDLRLWNVDSFEDLRFEVDVNADGRWMGRSYLHWQDEVLRLDGLDADELANLSQDDFLI